jgi:hypothetical protein
MERAMSQGENGVLGGEKRKETTKKMKEKTAVKEIRE